MIFFLMGKMSFRHMSFRTCLSVCPKTFVIPNRSSSLYDFHPGPTRRASKGRRSRPICEWSKIGLTKKLFNSKVGKQCHSNRGSAKENLQYKLFFLLKFENNFKVKICHYYNSQIGRLRRPLHALQVVLDWKS